MAETNQTTSPVETPVEKTSRLQSLRTRFPRATKVAGLIAGAAVVVGVTSTVKNMKANKAQLAEAADHAEEALHALADSVSTPDTDV